MKFVKVKAAALGLGLSVIVLIVGFQNCSQTQFTGGDIEGISSLASRVDNSTGEVDSSTPRTATNETVSVPSGVATVIYKTDTVTPRIVLSDSFNGEPKVSFSPKRIIHGTVYGIGKDNVHVCMAANYGCDYYPGYRQSGSTAAHYSKPVGQLPNWRWQDSDKTWRFTLDYKDVGDILDRVVLHYYIPEAQTDYEKFNFVNPEGIKLRLESYVFVHTPSASEAGIYFTSWGRDTVATLDGAQIFGVNVMQSKGVNGTFTNITGLSSQVSVCMEKSGTGRCASNAAAWVTLTQSAIAKYGASRNVWQISNSSYLVPSALGAVGGAYTLYAKDLTSGVTINSQFFLNPPQVYCSWTSSTAVIGPCSDPETSASQCTQAKVGQAIKGTGSCGAQYTCKCN